MGWRSKKEEKVIEYVQKDKNEELKFCIPGCNGLAMSKFPFERCLETEGVSADRHRPRMPKWVFFWMCLQLSVPQAHPLLRKVKFHVCVEGRKAGTAPEPSPLSLSPHPGRRCLLEHRMPAWDHWGYFQRLHYLSWEILGQLFANQIEFN